MLVTMAMPSGASSVALTLLVETGWLCGIAPLAGIHDTFLAWPNVWPLDRLWDGVVLVLRLFGVHL